MKEIVCGNIKTHWEPCDHTYQVIAKRGKYYVVTCSSCQCRAVCVHAPNDRYLVCEDCLPSIVKEGEENVGEWTAR
jgi:PHP family Zn ribbon phosphoesterase